MVLLFWSVLQSAIAHQAPLQPSQLLGARIDAEREAFVLATAIRTVLPAGRPVVLGKRLCRADLIDPECPKVSVDMTDGPGIGRRTQWRISSAMGPGEAGDAPKAQVQVQPPLVANDTIYTRLLVTRSKKQTVYDFAFTNETKPVLVRHGEPGSALTRSKLRRAHVSRMPKRSGASHIRLDAEPGLEDYM